MSTQWTVVFQAHSGTPDEKSLAISRLMCRYAGAVHRYLLKALKDPEAAAELDQEFAVRFLRGDFHRVRSGPRTIPRLREAAVQNLINDYHRRKRPKLMLDSAHRGTRGHRQRARPVRRTIPRKLA